MQLAPHPPGRRVTHIHRRPAPNLNLIEGKDQQAIASKTDAAAIAEQQEIASYDIYEGAIEKIVQYYLKDNKSSMRTKVRIVQLLNRFQ